MTRSQLSDDRDYCLLVSSCDAYADCWPPFFTLLVTYWEASDRVIYLNTETKDFAFPGLDIRCPCVSLDRQRSRRLAWSDRLRRCLDTIPDDIVLYVQEDYFLKDCVDVAMIDRLAGLMRDEDISHISMERDRRRGHKSRHQYLDVIDQRAEYRVSAQAGLWKTSVLKSYLRRHETVWEFEWYGTRRARRRRDTFLYVNDDYEARYGRKVFPYDGTGIVQGRWTRAIVEDLFARHDIEVDFAARGFLEDDGISPIKRPPRPVRALRRLRSLV